MSSPENFTGRSGLRGLDTRCRYMELSVIQLQALVSKAAELATIKTLIVTGHVKPFLKKSDAFRRYGRNNIEKWLTQGLVKPRKDGDHSAAWRLDLLEIETLIYCIQIERILALP